LPTRILVVDDDRPIADSLCTILRSAGHEPLAAYSALEAVQQIPSFQPQLVIVDVIMPGKTGIDLASELRASLPDILINIILLSGNAGTEELLRQAGVQLEGVLVLAKPFPPRQLLRIIDDLTATLAA
jgi:CheY-like chemotaxis protein